MDWTLLLAAGVGAGISWVLARLFSEKVVPVAATSARPQPPVVSDPPELSWIARANGALGVWLRRSDRGGIVEVTDPSVRDPVKRAIESRLSGLATPSGRSEEERIEEGSVVYIAGDDLQLAILLPPKQPFAQAQRDLEGFLGVLRTREMLEVASQKPASGGETAAGCAGRPYPARY